MNVWCMFTGFKISNQNIFWIFDISYTNAQNWAQQNTFQNITHFGKHSDFYYLNFWVQHFNKKKWNVLLRTRHDE